MSLICALFCLYSLLSYAFMFLFFLSPTEEEQQEHLIRAHLLPFAPTSFSWLVVCSYSWNRE